MLSLSLISLRVWLGNADEALLQLFLVNYPLFCPDLIAIDLSEHLTVSCMTIKVLSQIITHYKHLDHLDITILIDDIALIYALSQSFKILVLLLYPEKSNLHQVPIPSDAIPFCYVET